MPTESLASRAVRLLRTEGGGEAIAAYKELLGIRRDSPDDWYNLAYLQRRQNLFEEALVSYQAALDHGVTRPEDVHINRAAILSEHLDSVDLAEAELLSAITISPSNVIALNNLANLYEDQGDGVRAAHAYEKVLVVDPANARALSRHALLDKKAEQQVDRLRTALARPGTSTDEAATIGFALGHCLDRAGRFDEAFAAFQSANLARLASLPSGTPRYDSAAHELLVGQIIEAFASPTVPEAGDLKKPPIFICGMFRSGSTLVEQILAAHSDVTAGGELFAIPEIVRTMLAPYPAKMATLDEAGLQAIRKEYSRHLNRRRRTSSIITDKRPDNFLHVGLIKRMFPDAPVIHTKRCALDNILSIYFTDFADEIVYGFSIDDIVHWYGQYERLFKHWTSIFGETIIDVDYDALVASPVVVMQNVMQRLGLSWEEDCLQFHKSSGVVRTASVWQVRQPLYRHASGRWHNYATHLAAAQQRLTDLRRA